MIDESKDMELERLEAELRKFPQPLVPVDLEAKLLSAIPRPIGRSSRPKMIKLAASIAIAAGLIAAFGIFFFESGSDIQPEPRLEARLTEEEVELILLRESTAARLHAATQILAAAPGGEAIAEETFEYLARHYADTETGKQLIQSQRRNQ